MGDEAIAVLVVLGVLLFFCLVYVGIPLLFWGISVTKYKQNELLMEKAKKRLSTSWGEAIGAVAVFLGISVLSSVLMQFGGLFFQIAGAGVAPLISASGDSVAVALFLMLLVILLFILFLVLVLLVQFALYAALTFGYAKFMILFTRGEKTDIALLFEPFRSKKLFKTVLITYLLKSLYIALWGMLFVIPGYFALYSYALTMFILAENPELKPSQALEKSKRIMQGHRAELFWLHCRFIGWGLLTLMSGGIGLLWLYPYMMCTTINFYEKLKRRSAVVSPEERIQLG